MQSSNIFWRRCRGARGFLQVEFHASNLFTLLLSCLVYFYFILFAFNYQKHKKISFLHLVYFGLLLCLFVYLISMASLFETKSCWLSGFTEEQQNYYKEYRLSQKGKHLWEQISRLNYFAKNLCSTFDESYCFNESFYCRRHKHLPFQCDYNDNETLAAYAKGNYDFGNLE